jgi:predicted Zn-dependent peptidase
LQVAVSILSDRLVAELREKEGLAYRVGAGVAFDRNFGWLMASMGTGSENYEQAKAGILQQMDLMKNEAVTAQELERAVNSIWGSMLTARLSRINQAFYMAVNQFLGRGYAYEDNFIQRMRSISADDVRRVAQQYFNTTNYALASAGAP